MNALAFFPHGRAHTHPVSIRFQVALIFETEILTGDPELGFYPAERRLDLGESPTVEGATALAQSWARLHDWTPEPDHQLAATTGLVAILDSDHRLLLAGEIRDRKVVWCDPVSSDADAQSVVMAASTLRSAASRALIAGEPGKARELRQRASAFEARLVDPAWRQAATVFAGAV